MRVGAVMRSTMFLLLATTLLVPSCKKLEPKVVTEAKADRDEARDKRVRQACASQTSYERLKALVFDQAERARGGNVAMLDRLAANTVVRMEEPVVKSRDDALNVTVCTGRMVIDLPPGAEAAFNGERRLVADVEYAAQAAADGSGLVYSLDGADPIVSRLAAVGAAAGPLIAQASPPLEAKAFPDEPEIQSEAAEPVPAPAPLPRPPQPRATPQPEPPRPVLARPSFNCRYARTRTEQMVCSDERLAAHDRDMASLYYRAVANTDPETRAILRRTRDRFLARRERCDGPACVAAAYEDRIDEIDRIASGE